jgi:hypothetical protein
MSSVRQNAATLARRLDGLADWWDRLPHDERSALTDAIQKQTGGPLPFCMVEVAAAADLCRQTADSV